jgi:hypothetical protein
MDFIIGFGLGGAVIGIIYAAMSAGAYNKGAEDTAVRLGAYYAEPAALPSRDAIVTTTARMLVDWRDRSDAQAQRLREAAQARGIERDCAIYYAEGSAHAYSIAGAILAGASGAASVDDLTGSDWDRPRDMSSVILPDGINAKPVGIRPDGGVVIGDD